MLSQWIFFCVVAAVALRIAAWRAAHSAPEFPCTDNPPPLSSQEDAALQHGVAALGPKNWKRISVEWLLEKRSDVQCVHRWQKVLRPGLKKGNWDPEVNEAEVQHDFVRQ